MGQTFWEKWQHRIGGAWDVLVGRAWAGYGNPMDWEYAGPLNPHPFPDHYPTEGSESHANQR
jgi:hypothetical protein